MLPETTFVPEGGGSVLQTGKKILKATLPASLVCAAAYPPYTDKMEPAADTVLSMALPSRSAEGHPLLSISTHA
jgi:hypothetical protein